MGLQTVRQTLPSAMRVKVPQTPVERLSKTQTEAFLRRLKRYRDISIVYLMLLCGLRSREVRELTLGDIDFENQRLRTLHASLADQSVELPQLERPHNERWLRALYERGQGASTRVNIMQRGLLLMRRTSLRLGELAGLVHDCVRRDENGNVYLKVPFGKMHNERLVPMDPATAAIAEKLRGDGRPDRTLHIETVRGPQTRHWQCIRAMSEASNGLELSEQLTSHRLRHTYATSLMNGGMSLIGVMKLLGHRDCRMTLRYTEITLETAGEEGQAALTTMETRYRIALEETPAAALDPDSALEDIERRLKKRGADNPALHRRGELLADRLRRIRKEVRALDI